MTLEGGEFSHLLDDSDALASDRTLRSIVARSNRHRDRRLKAVTGTAVVLAVTAGTIAGVSATSGTSPTLRAATKHSSGFLNLSAGSTSWTKEHRTLGAAPKGLEWSATSKSSSISASPSARAATPRTSIATPDLCTVDGCVESLPYPAGALQRLFVRTSGDVTVRAFKEPLNIAQPLPFVPAATATGASGATGGSASSPTSTTAPNSTSSSGATGAVITPIRSCEANEALVVEVSNPGAIGELTVPLPGIVSSGVAEPFALIDSSVVGVAESSPIEVITLYVGPNVNSVEASFSDGATDEMTATDGWAVLVDDGSAPLPANLTAFDSSGASIGTAMVSSDDAIAEPQQCFVSFPVEPNAGASGSTSPTTSK